MSLLLRGILAAVRLGIHLSACSVLPGHLFLFEGQATRIAVELKIGAKTSLEQVVKYALFLRHYQNDPDGAQKRPSLLYLCRDPVKVWPDDLSFTNYRDRLRQFPLTEQIRSFAKVCEHSDADVLAIAAKLPVAHLTYREFGHFLRGEAQRLDLSDGAETLRNLIGGVLGRVERAWTCGLSGRDKPMITASILYDLVARPGRCRMSLIRTLTAPMS